MARDVSRLPFTCELKKMGFVRRSISSRDPLMYRLKEGDRTIELYLRKDGKHYVTNFYRNSNTTRPTFFTTVFEMKSAVLYEKARDDHVR